MHHHALRLELHDPVILCGKPTTEIVVLQVNCSDKDSEVLLRNVLDGVNTNYGEYSLSVSNDLGDPFNPQNVMLNIQMVKDIWKI